MAGSQRLIQVIQTPLYRNTAFDAAVGREAHHEHGGGASPARVDANPNAATAGSTFARNREAQTETRVSTAPREAHLETVGSAKPPVGMSVSGLQRLSTLLQRDENLARKLAKNPRRALANVDFISERDKEVLAGIDSQFWSQVAAVSGNPQRAGGKGGLLEGVTGGAVQLPESSAADPFGGSAPMGWRNIGGPSGRGIDVGNGVRVGGRASGDVHPSGDGTDGPPSGGDVVDYGVGRSARDFGPSSNSSSIDGTRGGWQTPYGYGSPFSQKGQSYDYNRDQAAAGNQAAPSTGYDMEKWNDKATVQNAREAQAAAMNEFEGGLSLTADYIKAVIFNEYTAEKVGSSVTGGEEDIGAMIATPPHDEPPKPTGDGSNPNPDDPGGRGPSGPRERLAQQYAYRGGADATPNYEGTGSGGPIGPRSAGLGSGSRARGFYGPAGREAVPNYEGTSGSGPVGPRSMGASRRSGRTGIEITPNLEGTGGSGPAGPR